MSTWLGGIGIKNSAVPAGGSSYHYLFYSPVGPARWTRLCLFGIQEWVRKPLVLAPTQDMDLGSFRAHQLPSLSLFLVFNISKTNSYPVGAHCQTSTWSPHRSFAQASKAYVYCVLRLCLLLFPTMKEYLDSNRVNFLIWRYAVTCFPYPVPILSFT